MTGFLDAPVIESGGGYQIQRSLRLRASASASLQRTFGAATLRGKWTYSVWFKRSRTLINDCLLNTDNQNFLEFFSDDTLICNLASVTRLWTNAKYRDPSSVYHIVLAYDEANATAAQRLRLYVNGVEVTSFQADTRSAIAANGTTINTGTVHYIGVRGTGYADGYPSEPKFIDGQALTPSSFGEYDPSGNWRPKAYAGTYGANGTAPDFSDPTSLTTLMLDRSGNGNNWTANNISLTAGATYDSMLDVPLGGGGNERGNYATLNPLARHTYNATALDANLAANNGGSTAGALNLSGTQVAGVPVYIELTAFNAGGTLSGAGYCGFQRPDVSHSAGGFPGSASGSFGFGVAAGTWFKRKDGAAASAISLSNYSNGTVMRIAFNPITGEAWVGKDSAWNGTGNPSTGANPDLTGITDPMALVAGVSAYNDGTNSISWHVNFGQRPFAYPPPSGFKALHTGNLPDPSILNPKEHHNVYTVTKSGNTNFTLDWDATVYDTLFIIKRVDSTGSWYLVDGLRGYDKVLYCPSTSAENTDANVIGASGTTCTLKSTLADGNYVIEAHKAGLSAARSTNTSGTITSTVSANLVSGFSMVTYTGTAANATVGHGQGTATQYGIVRNRSSSVDNWNVYHAALTSPAYRLRLNTTDPEDSVPSMWNSTAPTSSVFSVGTQTGSNGSASPMLAYWWSARPGYSAFTSYTGNASADGPYPHLGFKARGVETKGITVTSDWLRLDAKRNPSNPVSARLIRNTTDPESSGTHLQDFTANGDKIRNSSATGNNSGSRYLINAFAEAPFKYSLAR